MTFRVSAAAYFKNLKEQWVPNSVVRDFLHTRLFVGILVLKVVLGSVAASHYLRDLFIPFVNYFVSSGFSDPWKHFFELGRTNAFPYPPVMLYVLSLPRLLFAPLLPGGVDVSGVAHFFVMRLPLLAFDFMIAMILLRWFPHRSSQVLKYYWCSPLVIYISYWHGQLDIIPTGIFLLSLHLLRERRHVQATALLAIALATKSHLLVAVPFFAIQLWEEWGWRKTLSMMGLAATIYAAAVFPFFLRPEFVRMVYNNPEQARFTAYQIHVGDSGSVLLLAPAAILLLWLRFVSYKKRNWDLFMLYMGLLFSIFILLAPPAPGYFIWSLPFLVYFLCRETAPNVWPYAIYAASYLFYFWTGPESDLINAWSTIVPGIAAWPSPMQFMERFFPGSTANVRGLGFTVMQAALAGQTAHMYLFGVRSNAVYRMRIHPVMIGVAGDSAAGKDYFASSIMDALGRESSLLISGDDYHRWPRGDQMWSVYTHLDVRGNNLTEQHRHAIALSRGRSVIKGTYDHESGRFTEERVLDPSRYVVFCGLHALSNEELRDIYDLKIFMDPGEDLRRSWKIRRDSAARGYSTEAVVAALDKREPDRLKYILPQREKADLTVRWTVEGTVQQVTENGTAEGMFLEITASNSFDLLACAQLLSSVESLSVEHDPFLDIRNQHLRLRGTISEEAIQKMAGSLVPNLEEICTKARFRRNLDGCLQLIVLSCLSNRLSLSQLKSM